VIGPSGFAPGALIPGALQEPLEESLRALSDVMRYCKRLSSRLMGSIDIFVHVPRVHYDKLTAEGSRRDLG
jgi:hypothetical protein